MFQSAELVNGITLIQPTVPHVLIQTLYFFFCFVCFIFFLYMDNNVNITLVQYFGGASDNKLK